MGIQFEHERNLKVPCANTLCEWHSTDGYGTMCDSEKVNCDPFHIDCKLYFPVANSELLKPCEHKEAVMIEGYCECLECKKLFWM